MTERYTAMVALLAQPDLPCLPARRHRVTCPGDVQRRQRVLLPLLVRWAQRRCLAVDPDPEIMPALRGGFGPCRNRVVGFEEGRRRMTLVRRV